MNAMEELYGDFIPDKDGIIPITDDEYFSDDIVIQFVSFLEKAFGKESVEQNLEYIAKVLRGKGSSREVIRRYFNESFFEDHCATYSITGSGKRPIYWLFDSGKNNGFKCLMYVHRYQPDMIARVRTDYVHELQSRYRTEIEEIQGKIDQLSGNEKINNSNRLKSLRLKADEIHLYEEIIHHIADQMISIDLDDGVKANYALFQDVLAKIK